MLLALGPHSFKESLSWKHRLPNHSPPFLAPPPYPMSLTSWPPYEVRTAARGIGSKPLNH